MIYLRYLDLTLTHRLSLMLTPRLLIPALLALSPFCLKAADVAMPVAAATAMTKEQAVPVTAPDATEEESSENAPRDEAAVLPTTPVAKKVTADCSSDGSDDADCTAKPAVVKK